MAAARSSSIQEALEKVTMAFNADGLAKLEARSRLIALRRAHPLYVRE